jgi:hypothetical protein
MKRIGAIILFLFCLSNISCKGIQEKIYNDIVEWVKDDIYWQSGVIPLEEGSTINEMTFDITQELKNSRAYCLDIYLLRVNDGLFKPHTPVHFEYTVEMKRGKKIKEKKFALTLGDGSTKDNYLFAVPKDFFWSPKGNLRITIKNFSYDENIFEYYKAFAFNLRRAAGILM